MVGDLTKSDFIKLLVGNTIQTFGKLDVLVNNAGIYPGTNITQTDLMQVWDQVFNIDLRAVVELIHESVPHLEKTNGTIIDISSIAGIAPVYNTLFNKFNTVIILHLLIKFILIYSSCPPN